jgi:hypothetical protein
VAAVGVDAEDAGIAVVVAQEVEAVEEEKVDADVVEVVAVAEDRMDAETGDEVEVVAEVEEEESNTHTANLTLYKSRNRVPTWNCIASHRSR